MKTFWLVLGLLAATAAAGVRAQEKPDKALCLVCAVHGETEKERVKAHAEHDGETYYFCADKCRAAFQEDPLAYVPPQLPRPAPSFVVETLDGKDVAAAEFKGKVVLVDFWATWCKPCEKIMPRVQKLYDKYEDKGFTVAGISIDDGEKRTTKVAKFLKKYDVSYPVFLDAKDVPAWFTYRVKAVPAMFLIDREGQIVAQWLGSVDHERVETEVAKLVEAPRATGQPLSPSE
jgi:thiol-disulfide isomerase/thioredoxin